MNQQKILFIDRDGTLIVEPEDKQIDSLDKLQFMPGVFNGLQALKNAGFRFVMVSNQDGLGTTCFPESAFQLPQQWMLNVFASQGITFDAIRICPHFEEEKCACRKPQVGLVLDYLNTQKIDRKHSYVIGDRESDRMLATNMGIESYQLGSNGITWEVVSREILNPSRRAYIERKTNETSIEIGIDLGNRNLLSIDTGIGFFDHMLAQLAAHGGFGLEVKVKGDIEIDDHHTVEDTALVLGQALCQALGDKRGIGRYGFLLPMDESLAQVALDLSARPYFVFQGKFPREKVGELSTECVPHFFRSFAQTLGASLHIAITGENAHHMVEAIFKAVGRSLRQAIEFKGSEMPSTKGVL